MYDFQALCLQIEKNSTFQSNSSQNSSQLEFVKLGLLKFYLFIGFLHKKG